jgi:proteasome lid subunit RPN8/RPN11
MARRLIPELQRRRSRADRPARRKGTDGDIIGLRAISEHVIYPHVFANADREVGGVLVGRMPADGSLPLITGAIPAISADERRATLTFTQDAWAHVHRVLDSDFPADEQIVGWYHSHPGFGIFLSGHDLFIHENFFGAPSQIAVVVDPWARSEGAFRWQAGELAALFERPTPPGWVSTTEPDKAMPPIDGNGVRHAHARREPGHRSSLLALLVAGLIGVLLGFGLWSLLGGGSSATVASQTSTVRPTRPATPRVREGTQSTSEIEVIHQN